MAPGRVSIKLNMPCWRRYLSTRFRKYGCVSCGGAGDAACPRPSEARRVRLRGTSARAGGSAPTKPSEYVTVIPNQGTKAREDGTGCRELARHTRRNRDRECPSRWKHQSQRMYLSGSLALSAAPILVKRAASRCRSRLLSAVWLARPPIAPRNRSIARRCCKDLWLAYRRPRLAKRNRPGPGRPPAS
jgi:hypothetical protein